MQYRLCESEFFVIVHFKKLQLCKDRLGSSRDLVDGPSQHFSTRLMRVEVALGQPILFVKPSKWVMFRVNIKWSIHGLVPLKALTTYW